MERKHTAELGMAFNDWAPLLCALGWMFEKKKVLRGDPWYRFTEIAPSEA